MVRMMATAQQATREIADNAAVPSPAGPADTDAPGGPTIADAQAGDAAGSEPTDSDLPGGRPGDGARRRGAVGEPTMKTARQAMNRPKTGPRAPAGPADTDAPGGRRTRDAQAPPAAGSEPTDTELPGGRDLDDTHISRAVGEALLAEIYSLQRDREDFLNEERSLTLRMGARLRRIAATSCPEREAHSPKCKRCVALAATWMKESEALRKKVAKIELSMARGKTAPSDGELAVALLLRENPAAAAAMTAVEALVLAQVPITAAKEDVEKQMKKRAMDLPVAWFMTETYGFGELGLAQIVGEAGDLAGYSNPGKLWKRFGLAVINGRAQQKSKDKEEALVMGFSPKRRAVMHVIGDSLIKANKKPNPYRELYLERKAYEASKTPDAKKMQHHMRALRYMEKRLLKKLWQAWRASAGMEPACSRCDDERWVATGEPGVMEPCAACAAPGVLA